MRGKRVVWPEVNRAVVEVWDVPDPGPDEVVSETLFSLVSPGTERAWLGAAPNTSANFPHHPGYGAVGRIIAIGSAVTDLKLGDRVVGGGHTSHVVHRAERCIRITDDATDAAEAAFVDLAVMALQGVRKARIELGESALVMGQGLMGLMASQFARLQGALPLIATDLDAERRALAEELGVDAALDPQEEDFAQRLKDLTGSGGVDAVIEVTGAAPAMHQALEHVAWRGRIIALGCARATTDGINFYSSIHRPGVTIIGAHNSVRPKHDSQPGCWTMADDRRTFLALLAAKRLGVAPLISRFAAPDDAPTVYQNLAVGTSDLGVLFDWQQERC